MTYVLIICAGLLNGHCAPNYFAFDSFASCEAARTDLKSEYQWAKCVPESAVEIPELEPEDD